MDGNNDYVFHLPLADGISSLPQKPGIYGMYNRVTRMFNIGETQNIHSRCRKHRSDLRAGIAYNMRMRRDAEKHGPDVYFYFALEIVDFQEGMNLKAELGRAEVWWVRNFQAHDERYGYNSEAGGYRTMGARFRDREMKLMRPRSGKYELLPGVDMYDPIHPALLDSWIPGS